jgi:catechol 2,3-dioxygenase-like lactoylglutathione lyase family enzyme
MVQGIDHIVILVDDLETATAQYRQLGFTVNPGGKHPRGTHNALVIFQDGSYLELIAFWEPDYEAHRWHRHLGNRRGLIDFALAAGDLAADVAALNERGIRYVGPNDGARERPDGVKIAWKTASPEDTGATLPFLIEDVTDRDLRVPSAAATHANGVTGVERIVVVVDDLATATSRYAGLLSAGPISDGAGQAGTATFQTGSQKIELRQAGGVGQAVTGPVAMVLSGTAERAIDPEDAGGTQMRIVPSARA